jgi:hypothetical protein
MIDCVFADFRQGGPRRRLVIRTCHKLELYLASAPRQEQIHFVHSDLVSVEEEIPGRSV